MEYCCSLCNYKSSYKHHVKNHINSKRKSCINASIIENKIVIKCEFCNKRLGSKITLDRHLKICKVKEVEDLKIKLEEEKSKPRTTVNINNNFLQINSYRNTSFEHLTDRHFKRALKRMFFSVPQLIEDVHFNDNVPQNKNVFISNIKNKYAMVYDGSKWCSKPQDEVINQLILDQEYAIEEWLGDGEKFPNELRKFNEYIEKKEENQDIQNMIKEEVKLLLYNNRDKIKR